MNDAIFGFDSQSSNKFMGKVMNLSESYLEWQSQGKGFDRLAKYEAYCSEISEISILEKMERLQELGCHVDIYLKTKQGMCEIIIKEVIK